MEKEHVNNMYYFFKTIIFSWKYFMVYVKLKFLMTYSVIYLHKGDSLDLGGPSAWGNGVIVNKVKSSS